MKYNQNGVFVSTIIAFDTKRWETAVSHPKYNNNNLIIVAQYENSFAAMEGHNNWIKVMTSEPLPDRIVEVSSCMLKVLLDAAAGDNEQNIHVKQD